MAYASRSLSDVETRYAQIEKELLAIVFACERFELYIFGCDDVKVETDHRVHRADIAEFCPKAITTNAAAIAEVRSEGCVLARLRIGHCRHFESSVLARGEKVPFRKGVGEGEPL